VGVGGWRRFGAGVGFRARDARFSSKATQSWSEVRASCWLTASLRRVVDSSETRGRTKKLTVACGPCICLLFTQSWATLSCPLRAGTNIVKARCGSCTHFFLGVTRGMGAGRGCEPTSQTPRVDGRCKTAGDTEANRRSRAGSMRLRVRTADRRVAGRLTELVPGWFSATSAERQAGCRHGKGQGVPGAYGWCGVRIARMRREAAET